MVFTTEGHMLEVDLRPQPNRRRRTLPAEAPTCAAYHPASTDKQQHFLATSVGQRIDFEHARYLAGWEIGVEDEAREVREGRWSEWGFCEVARSEVRFACVRGRCGGEGVR